MPFKQLLKNTKSINIIKIVDKILGTAKSKAYLTSLIKERLREKGTDWEGKKLRTFASLGSNVYSLYTIEIKQSKGQTTDHVTLEDTGSYYKTFRAKIKNAVLIAESNEQKGDESISDNLDTSKVVGWTNEDIDFIVISFLLPKLKDEIIKKFLNGF